MFMLTGYMRRPESQWRSFVFAWAAGTHCVCGVVCGQSVNIYCPSTASTQLARDAVAVSDGGVVVGRLVTDLGQLPGYTWSLQTGMVPRALDPTAISADGTTVIGESYVWNATTGFMGIP